LLLLLRLLYHVLQPAKTAEFACKRGFVRALLVLEVSIALKRPVNRIAGRKVSAKMMVHASVISTLLLLGRASTRNVTPKIRCSQALAEIRRHFLIPEVTARSRSVPTIAINMDGAQTRVAFVTWAGRDPGAKSILAR
jgi:hypothetical protein